MKAILTQLIIILCFTAFAQQSKPGLYILAIGISDYSDQTLKLEFGAKDVRDFVAAISQQNGVLYGNVVIKSLIDKEATKEAITDGLEWIQKEATQKDVAMIYFSGHGANDNSGIFYMLPVAANLDRMRTTCLNFEELKQTVSNMAGKTIVWIDACHSAGVSGRKGSADMSSLVRELSNAENGTIVFSSTTSREYALESVSWNNGAFTKAVVEALNGGENGRALIENQYYVSVKSLDLYVSNRVKELTAGKQHTTFNNPNLLPDFPIAAFNGYKPPKVDYQPLPPKPVQSPPETPSCVNGSVKVSNGNLMVSLSIIVSQEKVDLINNRRSKYDIISVGSNSSEVIPELKPGVYYVCWVSHVDGGIGDPVYQTKKVLVEACKQAEVFFRD